MEQSELVKALQEKLDWCVEYERYEMAARFRDLIKYETVDDPEWKKEYMNKLMEKYCPPDLLDGIRNPTPEKIEHLKKKYGP